MGLYEQTFILIAKTRIILIKEDAMEHKKFKILKELTDLIAEINKAEGKDKDSKKKEKYFAAQTRNSIGSR
jgi:hypothetical protein